MSDEPQPNPTGTIERTYEAAKSGTVAGAAVLDIDKARGRPRQATMPATPGTATWTVEDLDAEPVDPTL